MLICLWENEFRQERLRDLKVGPLLDCRSMIKTRASENLSNNECKSEEKSFQYFNCELCESEK